MLISYVTKVIHNSWMIEGHTYQGMVKEKKRFHLLFELLEIEADCDMKRL